jgi:hypothetical protein
MVGTIVGFRCGDGTGILTTFPLLSKGDDPLARAILAQLVEVAGGEAFHPALELATEGRPPSAA